LEDQIEQEVRAAWEDYQRWQDETRLRAEELADLEKAGSGLKTPGGTSLSERAELLQWRMISQINLAEARYEMCVAKARLDLAIGRPVGG